MTSSQSGNANQLPSVALDARMISTPTYMFRARAIYDHHDMAAAGNWGIALPEAQRLGTRQAIFPAAARCFAVWHEPGRRRGRT